MSRGCRPIDGSSSTYSMLTRLEPKAAVRATRCASPPLKRAQACDRASGSPARRLPDIPAGLAPVRASCGRPGAPSRATAGRGRRRRASRTFKRADFGDVLAADAHGQGLGPQPRAAAGRAGAVAPPAAEEHADVHLVFPPLQPGEESLQAAELPLRHAVEISPTLLVGQLRERHVRPACRNRRPRPATLAVRARRPACSRARSPLRASDLFGSGTTRSMSMPITLPKPSHSGQAPSGLLKLYSRGSGCGYSMPQSSQARCTLNPHRCQDRPSMRIEGAARVQRSGFGVQNPRQRRSIAHGPC